MKVTFKHRSDETLLEALAAIKRTNKKWVTYQDIHVHRNIINSIVYRGFAKVVSCVDERKYSLNLTQLGEELSGLALYLIRCRDEQ